jgi:hypothetical protein
MSNKCTQLKFVDNHVYFTLEKTLEANEKVNSK